MPDKVLEGCQRQNDVQRTVFWPMNGRRGEYPACIIKFLTIDKHCYAMFVPGPQVNSSGIYFRKKPDHFYTSYADKVGKTCRPHR